MTRWATKRFGDVLDIRNGKNQREVKSADGEYPILGSAGKTMGYAREYICDAGTTILGRKGTINSPIFSETRFWNVDTAFGLSPKSCLDPKFLYHFCQSYDFSQHNRGTTIPSLVKSDLLGIEIPLPPLAEQRRIVAVLDEAFAAIAPATANAEQNLANARELFEQLLSHAFCGQLSEIQNGRMDDASLIQIIDGDRGANYPKSNDFFPLEHCLFLSTKNVRPDGFRFDETLFIKKEKDAQLRNGKLRRHDVVMTTRGTIGNIGYYSNDVDFEHIRINSGMLIFRANPEKIVPAYLFEMLRSPVFINQVRSRTSGAAQPQLPINTIKNFTFPLPTRLVDQLTTVAAIKEISAHTKSLESVCLEKLNALAALKQSILHRVFTGELAAAMPETIAA